MRLDFHAIHSETDKEKLCYWDSENCFHGSTCPQKGYEVNLKMYHDTPKCFVDKRQTTIYISGPMTGRDNFNAAEFERTREVLKLLLTEIPNNTPNEVKVDIITPFDLIDDFHRTYDDYLQKDLDYIRSTVTALYLLSDWSFSKGARAEVESAIELRLPILSSTEQFIQYYEERCRLTV